MSAVSATIIFLCVANSARSQLAEALGRRHAPPGVEVFSAGSAPWRVHPMAIRVLREIGLDIAGARSKGLRDVPIGDADLVITLCAEEVCPLLPVGTERLRWPIADPAGAFTPEDQLRRFRETRDDLDARIARFFEEWKKECDLEN